MSRDFKFYKNLTIRTDILHEGVRIFMQFVSFFFVETDCLLCVVRTDG